MMRMRHSSLWITLLAAGGLWGCASSKAAREGADPNLITHEEIVATGAVNLHEVVSRLRPQWMNLRSTRSFSMESEIVVFQDNMLLGGPDALKQIGPESAWEIRWMDGVRASASLPGITSGRHIEGAILISSRAPSRD